MIFMQLIGPKQVKSHLNNNWFHLIPRLFAQYVHILAHMKQLKSDYGSQNSPAPLSDCHCDLM